MLLSTEAQLALRRAHKAQVRSLTVLRAWLLITFLNLRAELVNSVPC